MSKNLPCPVHLPIRTGLAATTLCFSAACPVQDRTRIMRRRIEVFILVMWFVVFMGHQFYYVTWPNLELIFLGASSNFSKRVRPNVQSSGTRDQMRSEEPTSQ